MTRQFYSAFILCALAGIAGAACSTPVAPTELVEARVMYGTASSGAAHDLAPVALDNARVALAEAEASFQAHADDQSTRDLAYIAERRSRQAIALGNVAVAQRRSEAVAAAQGRRQADLIRSTSAQLQQTREQLDQERTARTEAEQTAAAALESLRRVAAVREEARGLVITLSGEVLFATGQSTLLPIAQQRLQQVAAMLRDHPRQTIAVEGHTDARGSVSANAALSLLRAQAVRNFLVSNGVPAERIRAEGLGPSRPVADNSTPEGRANNRRVEIVLAPEPGAPNGAVGGGPAPAP